MPLRQPGIQCRADETIDTSRLDHVLSVEPAKLTALVEPNESPREEASREPLVDYLFRYDRGAFWVGKYSFRYFLTPFNRTTRFLLDRFMHTRVMYRVLARPISPACTTRSGSTWAPKRPRPTGAGGRGRGPRWGTCGLFAG
ncbi:hypothetical protein E4U41_001421 [Claviceps citrina]|nr:hypothetical protein E4U41_001421 [Claviceps citrina]